MTNDCAGAIKLYVRVDARAVFSGELFALLVESILERFTPAIDLLFNWELLPLLILNHPFFTQHLLVMEDWLELRNHRHRDNQQQRIQDSCGLKTAFSN